VDDGAEVNHSVAVSPGVKPHEHVPPGGGIHVVMNLAGHREHCRADEWRWTEGGGILIEEHIGNAPNPLNVARWHPQHIV
jgi:hypothetical protein